MIKFTKMQGLGNDFVIIDATSQKVELSPEQIRVLANRHWGIGADQVLLVELSSEQDVDFFLRIFNADGSLAYQCINGVRCVAKFVKAKGLSSKREIVFSSGPRKTKTLLKNNGEVEVEVGEPIFEPAQIPLLIDLQAPVYQLKYQNREINFGAVSVGNPHAVLKVDKLAEAKVDELGAFLGSEAHFPEGVNVSFMQVVRSDYIKLRTYERGTGETLACGSGASAAVAVGRCWKLLSELVTVEMLGGTLHISWSGPGSNLHLIGPAALVFEGEWLVGHS